ncbi:MAG: hypothetical protein MZV63_50455 [Marinilabiliales bacterium]|nr:hypothetical protein [Marinilabiliales bacterium]
MNKGYTVNWDGDVSERGFSHANGVAINPDMTKIDISSMTDRARFENMPVRTVSAEVYNFDKPYPEIDVTQDIRQKGYETFVTTDDHLMHVTGIVKDQNGTKYYITKNSWGTDRNPLRRLPEYVRELRQGQDHIHNGTQGCDPG